MSDLLLDARTKVKRAEQHLIELHSGIEAFDATEHRVLPERNEYGFIAHTYRPRSELPIINRCIIGDTIHNLSAALDYLAYALVQKGGGTPGRNTFFPIFKDCPPNMDAAVRGKIGGASDLAVRMAASLKPYKGADNSFWPIHKLDIIDKHRLLLTTAVKADAPKHHVTVPGYSFVLQSPPKWEPCVDGTVLYVGKPRFKPGVEMDTTFSFQIAINEPRIIPLEPVLPLLKQYIDFTESVVDMFDRAIFQTP